MFQKVDAYAGDPILSLMERFKEDPRSDKVNLSIGLYYNEDGIIPQLQAVAEAEDDASKVDVSGAKTFQAARKLIRADLEQKALLPKIEALVLDVVPTAVP